MNPAIFLAGMGIFSLTAFTALGLAQRWPLRLSLTYAGTMTIFLAAIVGTCTLLNPA